jgi:hypothetical protein
MGRPLKTSKVNGTVDYGFPSTTSGIVGGNTGQAGNQILARVKIGAQAEANGYIIRQKGKSKFLVGSVTSIQDEDIAANASYVITSLSNTDWTALGASSLPTVGEIFTAKKSGAGLTTNGVVNQVTVCTLANTANAALVANTMTVTCTYANSSTFRAKTISNHHVTNFSDVKFIANFNTANASTSPYATVTVANS